MSQPPSAGSERMEMLQAFGSSAGELPLNTRTCDLSEGSRRQEQVPPQPRGVQPTAAVPACAAGRPLRGQSLLLFPSPDGAGGGGVQVWISLPLPFSLFFPPSSTFILPPLQNQNILETLHSLLAYYSQNLLSPRFRMLPGSDQLPAPLMYYTIKPLTSL